MKDSLIVGGKIDRIPVLRFLKGDSQSLRGLKAVFADLSEIETVPKEYQPADSSGLSGHIVDLAFSHFNTSEIPVHVEIFCEIEEGCQLFRELFRRIALFFFPFLLSLFHDRFFQGKF